MAIRFLIILIFLLATSPTYSAEQPAKAKHESVKDHSSINTVTVSDNGASTDPFDRLMNISLSYFTPLQGTVTAVDNEVITADLGSGSGVTPGMRLTISRKGEPFLHPITKEEIGQVEETVGKVEVVEAGNDTSRLRVLLGEIEPGDILRLSSARVRVLFYQSSDVDWNLSEEYYYRLKNSERFDLIDTSPGTAADEEIIREAKNLNAEIAIVLSSVGNAVQTVLRQRILWVEDKSELVTSDVAFNEAIIRKHRLGEELFTPDENEPTVTFTIPYSARLIATGDMDGNGNRELIISTGNVIRFYTYEASLRPALNALEIKGKITQSHIWLDVSDINGDGSDELLVTSIYNNRIKSYLYGYSGTEFAVLWERDLFARIIDGKIYAQERFITGGYKGPVFRITPDAPDTETDEHTDEHTETLSLPENINIYDFRPLRSPDGNILLLALDKQGYMVLYDLNGAILWRSNDDYGGPVKTFSTEPSTIMKSTVEWHVSNRLIVMGEGALTVNRIPISRSAKGLGVKKSMIMGLYPSGNSVRETVIVDDIPGSIIDYAISNDKLFVLISSLGIKPLNLFTGKSIFTSKLYIYPLKGK
jgi:hypothetical protein